ncbi:MAG: ADP-ribosylglycohydrolase family protein [Elusimicrobia bacterium]|nr:ADP-ribosylglycohydrolase family protein [Elusimicrobiota bacterium]
MDIPGVSRFQGCLLGLMAGDALGLPREGLSPRRAERMFGRELRHALVFGRGMTSDDTELACFTAQAFAAHPADAGRFASALGWKLRFWFLGLPAGIGFATLRSIFKLWMGFPAARSGVRSAGNGPAIRAPVLGLACGDDAALRAYVRASTLLTHTDPRAERGALAVAVAARYGATHGPADFSAPELMAELAGVLEGDAEAMKWLAAIEEREDAAFVARMGFANGVSGYVYHTVPAALWAWLRSPFDLKESLTRVIALGGDSDTTGAVCGGLCGAAVGAEGVPKEWLSGICESPRSTEWVRALGGRLHAVAETGTAGELPIAWPLIAPRNAIFLAIVLAHGFRRLLPPYG